VNGPSNTFVYAMVLQNLDRCDEANRLMDRALELAERQQREAAADGQEDPLRRSVRNTESSYARVKSNLLVARSFCSKDPALAGKLMYDAVQADPTNEYALEQAKAMLAHYERLQKQQQLLMAQLSMSQQPA
jgi:hypothetical protein